MMRRNKNCIKFEHFGLPRQRHLSPPVLRWRCKRQLSTVAGRNESASSANSDMPASVNLCNSNTWLSAAMMLRFTFDLDKEADAVEQAVKQVLVDGYRTCDIISEGMTPVSCSEMGDLIAERIK